MTLTWNTEVRNIDDLKDFPNNPRTLSKKQEQLLNNSIKKFGYVEIIAIDVDNTILAGHMRVKLLKKNKVKQIEVRVPNRPLTQKERSDYVIASNKVSGDWDFDLLANNFELPDLVEWGFDASELFEGLDQDEIEPEKKGAIPVKNNKCPNCEFEF